MSPPPDPRPPGENAAISQAVHTLLTMHGESVADLSFRTRISVASLYRKLSGRAAWKAADVGAVARHYKLRPGDLFSGLPLGGYPEGRRESDRPPAVPVPAPGSCPAPWSHPGRAHAAAPIGAVRVA